MGQYISAPGNSGELDESLHLKIEKSKNKIIESN